MRTLEQIEEALKEAYSGPIKEINKFKYVPWHESNRVANKVFGPLGWSSTVLSNDYQEVDFEEEFYDWRDKTTKTRRVTGRGYKSTVRITVQYLMEGNVYTCWHDGVGYGPIVGQGAKDPLDTACKAAKSDGISTALKHFGDAFGLFLYDKPDEAEILPATGATTTSNGNSSYNGRPAMSEKQAAAVAKTLGISQREVEGLEGTLGAQKAREILNHTFGNNGFEKLSGPAILKKYGITVRGDGLPF